MDLLYYLVPLCIVDKDDTETVDGDKDDRKEKDEKILIEDAVKQEITELQTENKRLHELVTQLHQRHHETTLKVSVPASYPRIVIPTAPELMHRGHD